MDKFGEIRKLYIMLNEANIPCTLAPLYDGWQICVYADEKKENKLDDCILHSGSHGWLNGLLETYTLGGCDGWETAEYVLKGWQEMYHKANQPKDTHCDCTIIGAGGEEWEGSAPTWD